MEKKGGPKFGKPSSHCRGRHSSQGIINFAGDLFLERTGARSKTANQGAVSDRQGIAVEVLGTEKEARNGSSLMSSFFGLHIL